MIRSLTLLNTQLTLHTYVAAALTKDKLETPDVDGSTAANSHRRNRVKPSHGQFAMHQQVLLQLNRCCRFLHWSPRPLHRLIHLNRQPPSPTLPSNYAFSWILDSPTFLFGFSLFSKFSLQNLCFFIFFHKKIDYFFKFI